ncbi:hypothetical protein ZWY2020_033560 [Hordeum vulgare]|nr:hypothetical protein ZWY2020_033560 [Hordeum vulgare]
MSPTLSEEPVGHENEKIATTDDMVPFYQLPPDGYNQYKQSGLDTLQRTPCRSRYMGVEVSQTEEPSDAKLDKTTTSSVVKRGSHLRRSIQSSIGKLIHGSERRNIPHSAQPTPVKLTTNANNDGASPITTNTRLKRRQSLTGLPPPSSTMSRRSSLGGKSDSSSTDKKAKTPPPMNSAAKAKRWL